MSWVGGWVGGCHSGWLGTLGTGHKSNDNEEMWTDGCKSCQPVPLSCAVLRLSLLPACSERADISSSHAKAKKELQDMAEAMKVCGCVCVGRGAGVGKGCNL